MSDLKDTKQQFFTATDTDIQGAGKICGDAAGQAATPCSEHVLEAAAKNSIGVVVKIEVVPALVVRSALRTAGTPFDSPAPEDPSRRLCQAISGYKAAQGVF
ncbi:hypothetical protein [Streptomyces sp. NPDC057694]|uniref:hypothetical protein n=1 Tax=Streptomyces sp. NPDC057694 TaxID=3346216 RepID=UPI0036BAFE29